MMVSLTTIIVGKLEKNRNIQDNSYFHTSAFFLRVFLPMLNYNILNLFITFVSRDLFVPSSYIKKKKV